jgi:hypothetical protein
LLLLLGMLAAGDARAQPAAAEIFTDRAAETGLDFVHFNGMSGELHFVEHVGAGAALFDFDGDGDLDVYLVQGRMLGERPASEALFPPPAGAPLSDRLFRNDLTVAADGSRSLRFIDVTETAGLTADGYGMGVAAGDYDNDGWIDLYVTNWGPNQLWRNRGDGTFSDVTESAAVGDGRWGVPAAWFDLDRDGWLDLYVGNYVDFSLTMVTECVTATGAPDYCGPLAYEPQPDKLFRNLGDGTFRDVTRPAGMGGELGGALGVVTADFNGDGWPDVYVGNDGLPNQLWMNQGDGTFVNDALLAGCAVNWEGQPEASMGIDAGDVDGDGDEDLFMAHLTGETNTLYLNDGSGLFRDSTRELDLGNPSWGFTSFGTGWIDYDNDGRLDLAVVNGAVRAIEELAAAGDPYPLDQTNQLFRNLGGGSFADATGGAGASFAELEVSRGAAFGDIDNDGDTDLVVTNNAGPARLLINNVGQDAGWVGARLTTEEGRDALGARLALDRESGPPLWRRSHTDGSYASSNDPRVTVGLGAEVAGGLALLWPEGGRSRLAALPTGRFLTFLAPAGPAAE